ncbi:type I pullulanase [Mangrovivirga sp. M17]|uniref:Type I pullulanase n=1 Tax=Mangrovivirga halotolerans TaxID=2993936 RepID=A0ABT3RWS5_9BACT|nr:type I pullulanase [Mangrovivirga halotolerans]MCX2745672.1 type I pullulanase [Mangrovivirga halotolerans]
MKINYYLIIALLLIVASCSENKDSTTMEDQYPVYSGDDLGLTYSEDKSIFKLWAPTAEKVDLIFYDKDIGSEEIDRYPMKPIQSGAWEFIYEGDAKGKYYTYQVTVDDVEMQEVPGPYAKAVGRNGERAQVIDLKETNPEGWENDKGPVLERPVDAVIYEIHVRDFSKHPESGMENKGKFIAFAEENTSTPSGAPSGLNYIKDLGVTHLHILPFFDFASIDETLDKPNYNWGYDPINYNVPEGSYSTDPSDGAIRVKEAKQMIKAIHDKGMGVIMDVVYNHTHSVDGMSFNETVPEYYYRYNKDGSLSDAAACGNETASEKPMMRKFMIESLKYWMTEYHIDGFRFDLMGIHDIETMNQISSELRKIKPDVLLYGEGWKAGSSPLPDSVLALKANTKELVGIAAFSDDMRDGIKGSVFEVEEKGFVSGAEDLEESIKFGVTAATKHENIDYKKVNYSNSPWSDSPLKTVNYVSCHDNNTLFDRLNLSNGEEDNEEEILAMHKLALSMVITSQGITFLHAGSEMARTKDGVENSFESPDSINQIDWDRQMKYEGLKDYIVKLLKVHNSHPVFRLQSQKVINESIKFHLDEDNAIVFEIDGSELENEEWDKVIVIYNARREPLQFDLPEGDWKVIANKEKVEEAGIETISGSVEVEDISLMILVRE